jgi:hypothetical protein
MLNRDIRRLEEELIEVLNASPVMIETKRYVLLSVLTQVEKEANKAIIAENAPVIEEGEENAEST